MKTSLLGDEGHSVSHSNFYSPVKVGGYQLPFEVGGFWSSEVHILNPAHLSYLQVVLVLFPISFSPGVEVGGWRSVHYLDPAHLSYLQVGAKVRSESALSSTHNSAATAKLPK